MSNERAAGPTIDGSVLPERNLKVRDSKLLDTGDGLRPERLMCEKAGKKNYECQTELEYLTEQEAVELGLPPETRVTLHKCVRPGSKEGSFIPVNSVQEALQVSEDFCNCVGKPKAPPPPEVVKQKAYSASETRKKCARVK